MGFSKFFPKKFFFIFFKIFIKIIIFYNNTEYYKWRNPSRKHVNKRLILSRYCIMRGKSLENGKNLETLGIKETCFECETFTNIHSA